MERLCATLTEGKGTVAPLPQVAWGSGSSLVQEQAPLSAVEGRTVQLRGLPGQQRRQELEVQTAALQLHARNEVVLQEGDAGVPEVPAKLLPVEHKSRGHALTWVPGQLPAASSRHRISSSEAVGSSPGSVGSHEDIRWQHRLLSSGGYPFPPQLP